jgi:hypothetical protein
LRGAGARISAGFSAKACAKTEAGIACGFLLKRNSRVGGNEKAPCFRPNYEVEGGLQGTRRYTSDMSAGAKAREFPRSSSFRK